MISRNIWREVQVFIYLVCNITEIDNGKSNSSYLSPLSDKVINWLIELVNRVTYCESVLRWVAIIYRASHDAALTGARYNLIDIAMNVYYTEFLIFQDLNLSVYNSFLSFLLLSLTNIIQISLLNLSWGSAVNCQLFSNPKPQD